MPFLKKIGSHLIWMADHIDHKPNDIALPRWGANERMNAWINVAAEQHTRFHAAKCLLCLRIYIQYYQKWENAN